jgi:hypothetical protein
MPHGQPGYPAGVARRTMGTMGGAGFDRPFGEVRVV